MNHDLVGVINRDLKVQIDIHLRVVHRFISGRRPELIDILRSLVDFSVYSHDHLVSVGVDMALAQRDGLRQNIVARANKVDK